MKNLALALLLFGATAYSGDIGTDKYAHAAVSYSLSYTGMHLFPDDKWLSVAATFGLGVLKETLSDDFVDMNDVLANSIGIGLSVVVIELE
jgi:hypothetical protein